VGSLSHAWHGHGMGRITEFAGTGAGVDAAIPLKFLIPLYLFTTSSLSNHHLHFQLHLPSNCMWHVTSTSRASSQRRRWERKGNYNRVPQSTCRRSHPSLAALPTKRNHFTGHLIQLMRLGLRFKQIPFRGAGLSGLGRTPDMVSPGALNTHVFVLQ